MRVIVYGGCGFISSHLVDRLIRNGDEVIIVDNLSRGRNAHEQAQFVMANLEEGAPVIKEADVIFHLAAKVTGIEYNRHNHYDMLTRNLAINWNVMEAVRLSEPKLFVYTSTACVYPHDAPVPTPESYGDVCDPEPTNFGYGVAKWVGEQQAIGLYREHGIPTIITRFFNAYGPRDYYDEATSHVAPALIKRVMDGEDPVIVWGSGNQTRALVDARDIAKALHLLVIKNLDKDVSIVVNIGHEKEVSIRELAEHIVAMAGSPAELIFDTAKPDGYARRAADTTKLRELIGFVPNMPLSQTILDMIDDYKKRYQ